MLNMYHPAKDYDDPGVDNHEFRHLHPYLEAEHANSEIAFLETAFDMHFEDEESSVTTFVMNQEAMQNGELGDINDMIAQEFNCGGFNLLNEEILMYVASESLQFDQFSDADGNFEDGEFETMFNTDDSDLVLGSKEFVELGGAKVDENQCYSSDYISFGQIVSKICNHRKYCKRDIESSLGVKSESEKSPCCSNLSFGSSFDFQVEQSSLSGCECEHKKLYWISIRSASSYAIVGEVAILDSKILAPLVLGGFIRLTGEIVLEDQISFAEGIIPFRISIEGNPRFIYDSLELLSHEQYSAFLKLIDCVNIKSENSKDIEKLTDAFSKKKELMGRRNEEPCKSCQDKANVSKKPSAKRKNPSSGSVSAKSEFPAYARPVYASHPGQKIARAAPATSVSSSSVKNLLEERRRARAKDQIANCSEKEVGRLIDVIHIASSRIYKQMMEIFRKSTYTYGPYHEALALIDDALADFVSGKNPLDGLGCMVGATQAVFQTFSDSGCKVVNYQTELTRIEDAWKIMFDGYNPSEKTKAKKAKLVSTFLAKRLATTLLKASDLHNTPSAMLSKIWHEVTRSV